jgi:hypothetical protein
MVPIERVSGMTVCGKPTLVERIVNLIPGSFVLKCLVFCCFLGVPFLLLTRFLDTLSVQTALEVFGPLLWQNVVTYCFANFVLLFYAIYGVRYMRSKISVMVPEVEAMVPEDSGKNLYEVFKPVCRLTPAVIMSLLLVVASLASFPDQFGQHSAGLISLAQIVVSFPLVYLAYGTFIWVYASSIKCLYNLGKQPVKLAEFYEDSHMGVKPLGSLSLSLALVYFAGLGLVFFSFLSIPPPLEIAVGVMILGGIVLFLLPLNTIHQKMRAKKQLELEKLKVRYRPLRDAMDESLRKSRKAEATELRRIFAVDIIDRHVNSISEWPFDSRTLTWLSAIVLTVVVSIVTKYVTVLLSSVRA